VSGMDKMKKAADGGVTMIELISSFALLAIFMVIITLSISHSLILYYEQRGIMDAYSIADVIMSEMQDDIRTMQGSGDTISQKGYVKLRDANGATVIARAGEEIFGETLEFVAANENDADYAVQLDSKGFDGIMIKNHSVINDNPNPITSGHLTLRYYKQDNTEVMDSKYYGLYADRICIGSKLSEVIPAAINTVVARDAVERVAIDMYQNRTIKLSFSVTPIDDGEGNLIVSGVYTTLEMYNEDELIYKKQRFIDFQNKVFYKNADTMYSEVSDD